MRIKLAMSGLVIQDFRYTLMQDGQSLEFNRDNADLDEVKHARRLSAGDLQLDAFDEALVRFKELADEYAFAPIVIYIPSAYSAYWPNVRFADAALKGLMPWFMDQHGQYFGAKSRELGIRFFDVSPVLREAAAKTDLSHPLYFPINRHLTPLGHEIVATYLARMLGERGVAARISVERGPDPKRF